MAGNYERKDVLMKNEDNKYYSEDAEKYADELSEYYERQSRRYSKTLDCESEEE